MLNFELLAGACDPDPSCPKVVRVAPGRLVVVGQVIAPVSPPTEVSSVSITNELCAAALHRISGSSGPASFVTGTVVMRGRAVADPGERREFGVGPGEDAVRITEATFVELAGGTTA